MRTSIRYRTEEESDKSGSLFVLSWLGMGGKADGDNDYGYLYYHTKTNDWYEYDSDPELALSTMDVLLMVGQI